MDEPTNPMVVTGVLVLETPVSVQRLRTLIQQRLLRFERFRQRIVRPLGRAGLPSWEPDPHFSLDHQLVVETLPAPENEAALQDLLGSLATRPLPLRRPPWRIHFIPHYQGGSALVVRIHHCIGDGLALVHVLLSMADQPAALRMPMTFPGARPRGRSVTRSPPPSGFCPREWATSPPSHVSSSSRPTRRPASRAASG
jgi:hypothetical protein